MIKYCSKCKKEFIIIDGEQEFKTCSNCRKKNRRAKAKWQAKQKIQKTCKLGYLDMTLGELDKYQEEHDLHISYGKFVALRDLGLLESNRK